MSGQSRITDRDVQAARHAVARTEKRIRAHGEEVVAQAVWDEAIKRAMESPGIRALHAALSEIPVAQQHDRDQQREAAHQRVVRFVQDSQRAE